MVNIRATLKAALDKSIIGDASHNALLGVGKRLFYPDRTYPKVLELAAEAGVAATEIESFRRFLEKRRVDQKRADGLELLGELKALRAEGRGPPEANFFFTATDRWVRLVEWAATQPPLGVAGDVVPDEWIAAEARLDAGADALVA